MPGPLLPGGRGPREPQDAVEWYNQRKQLLRPNPGIGITNANPFLNQSFTNTGTWTATTHRFSPIAPISQDLELASSRIFVGTAGSAGEYAEFGIYLFDHKEKKLRLLSNSQVKEDISLATGAISTTLKKPVRVKSNSLYLIGSRVDSITTGNVGTIRVVSSGTQIKEFTGGVSSGLETIVSVDNLASAASGTHMLHVQYFTADGALLF